MNKLLFDEQPLVLSRGLANAIGLNEAIVLQQIHYWLEINRKAGNNFRDGKFWTYNSMKNWHEKEFSFWSMNTVQRVFASLEKKGFLISGNYNKKSFDQTKWYSIDYDALEALISPITPKWGNASHQDGAMQSTNLGQTIPEISTEINPLSFNPISSHHINEEGHEKTDEIRVEKKKEEKYIGEANGGEKIKKGFQNATTDQSSNTLTKAKPRYDYTTVEEIIKDNIGYDDIISDAAVSENMLDEIVQVTTSTICSEFKDGYVSMGEQKIPAEAVKSVFFKLNRDDIEYFAECFDRNPKEVKKFQAYMRAALYRNHATIEHHYANLYRANNPHPGKPNAQRSYV